MSDTETDRLRCALTVALQGLAQLAKSRENKSHRPSNRQLVKRAEQTIIRVMRVLNGQETKTADNGKVSLVTLPKDRIERNESTELGREIWAAVDVGAEKAPQIVKDRLAENNDE